MARYWQGNPNHYAEWGEKGGLPIDRLTLTLADRPRVIAIRLIRVKLDSNGKPIKDINGFIILNAIPPIYYGGAGKTPINARERQLERELPGSSPAISIPDDYARHAATLWTDGTLWYASTVALVGMTQGYATMVGGLIYANTTSSANDLTVFITGDAITVE